MAPLPVAWYTFSPPYISSLRAIVAMLALKTPYFTLKRNHSPALKGNSWFWADSGASREDKKAMNRVIFFISFLFLVLFF